MDGLNFEVPRKALKTHCVNGHEYTEETTIFTPKRSRQCRICKRLATKRWNFRRKLGRLPLTSFERGHARKPPHSRIALVDQMYQIADAQKVSHSDLSRTTGYHLRSFIQWRSGANIPRVTSVIDTFDALGYDLVPVKRGE